MFKSLITTVYSLATFLIVAWLFAWAISVCLTISVVTVVNAFIK